LFGFKTESFKRRDWIGHGITYFFSWLAFWIILLNPPFSDHVPPTIQSISVSPYHGGYTGDLACLPPAGSVSMRPVNDSLYLGFPREAFVERARPRPGVSRTERARARTDWKRPAARLLEVLTDAGLPPLRLRDGRCGRGVPGHVDGPPLPLHERTGDRFRTPS